MAGNRISPLRPSLRYGRSDRSPDRNPPPLYQDIDPLLSNLSPESTLQALSSTDAVPRNEKVAHDILSKSISQVSPAERALGIRAAVAAQNLSKWYKEVQSWTWPKRTDVHLGKGFIPPSPDVAGTEYYGSLPAEVVERNEKRIEEIRDAMDNLDVEELKEHVLNAHIPSRSRPSSSNSTVSVPPPLSYVQLSDFTAVITATILRALPFLSRLNSLLSTWDVRLLVLRQIPGLLRGLQLTRSILNSSLDSLKSLSPPSEDDPLFSRSNFQARHAELQAMVVSVGRRMDNILDALEGREDSLPENWIDDLEAIESDFSTWVVEAERRAVENEWRRQRISTPHTEQPSSMPDQIHHASDPIVKTSDPGRQQGRSFSMETINEEPSIASESATEEESSDEESSGKSSAVVAPIAEVPTTGSPITESPNIEAPTAAAPVTETPTTEPATAEAPSTESTAEAPTAEALITQTTTAKPSADEALLVEPHTAGAPNIEAPTAEVSISTTEVPLVGASITQAPIAEHHTTETSITEAPITEAPTAQPTTAEPTTAKPTTAEPTTAEPNTAELPTAAISAANTHDTTTPSESGTEHSLADTDARPNGAHTTMEEPSMKDTATLNGVAIDHKPSSQEAPVPAVIAVEAPRPSQNKVLSSALPREITAPSPADVPSEKKATPSSSGTKDQSNLYLSSSSTIDDKRPSFEGASRSDNIHRELAPQNVFQSLVQQEQTTRPTRESKPVDCVSHTENNTTPFVRIEASDDSGPQDNCGSVFDGPDLQRIPTGEDESAALASVIAEAATPTVPASMVSVPREGTRSARSSSGSSEPSKPSMPSDVDRRAVQQPSHDDKSTECPPSKQHLESPIKLSKSRPGRLSLEKGGKKPRRRRLSNGSADSLSDYPSLVSSPEVREPRTASSNGTPLLLETPPHFQSDYPHSNLTPAHSDHTLREDRLLRLDSQKVSPHTSLKHNRAVSLPLQRFINERLDLNYEGETGIDLDCSTAGRRASVVSVDRPTYEQQQGVSPLQKERKDESSSSTPTNDIRRLASQHFQFSREESPDLDPGASIQIPRLRGHQGGLPKASQHGRLQERPAAHVATTRLRKQLTAHPSLESLRLHKSDSQHMEASPKATNTKTGSRPGSRLGSRPGSRLGSRPSTPSKQPTKSFRKPKDHLDEKISSILTTLPTRIHLVSSANHDFDGDSVVSSVPQRTQERFRSESPQGPPSRSSTPAPSMTLTPAVSRRRHSHAHAPEESSVKLYHLHRGGKTPATKLFVRTVGENGERVMVRVGGGWADLGEYLREYALHHGRRSVTESPRVEVQGLGSRGSPGYSSPGSLLAPHSNNTGRTTPSRPRSALSNRPASSLAVRKTRRSSNASDFTDLRAVSAGEPMNVSFSSMSNASRRLSVSSNNSFGTPSLASDAHNGSSGHSPATTIAAGSARSTPLGLAGPRARHLAISPESEAWVEDVLGQARKSASIKTSKFNIPPPEPTASGARVSSLPKARSVSDMGSAGTSKRVALRGLGNRIT